MPVRLLSRGAAISLALLLIVSAFVLATPDTQGREFALSLSNGALFGLLLQRTRFCFFCVTRDFIEKRIPDGILGILAALAVGTLGYHAIFGAFLPDPLTGRLPPDAHVGPVSWVLAGAAFIFGLGMSISGSCVSAHLYRLGEGAFASLAALAGVVTGFALGFMVWDSLYIQVLQQAPVIWLPNSLGYGGSLLLQLALLGGLAIWLLRYRKNSPSSAQPSGSLWHSLFAQRWPAWLGGALIGALALVCYVRLGPLGVTAELGSWARTGATAAGWLPERLQGLDGFAGCATVIKDSLLSNNGLFIVGLVIAAWAGALAAGDFKPKRPSLADCLRNALGGVLLGLGSMLALGCTIGTLLSGIMAGALSGWLFAVFCVLGLVLGLPLRRALRLG